MEIKNNTKSNRFNKLLSEKSSTTGIILMFFVFIASLVAYFGLNKISVDTMLITQVGAIVMILFFLLLDIQDKLDNIEKKISNK